MFRAMVEGPSSSLLQAIDRQDSMETHRILDQMPSEVTTKDGEERVALHYAAEAMNLETVKRILECDPSLLDCSDCQGYTPLLMAVQAGRNDVVQYLLDKGASLSHLDEDGHSLVHWSVVCGQLDVLNTLIQRGADISVADKYRATALHYATAGDELSEDTATAILLTLIRKGANVNGRDVDERTPLLWAASNGNVDALLSLKQAGGDILAVDRDRMGALHMAASHGATDMLEKILDNIGVNMVDAEERSGCTPLFYAVAYGYYETARILLTKQVDPNHQDHRLRTPAHVAAAKGQLRMLKLLKQFGGSFEMQNYRGDLPLHEAVQTGSKDVIEWLLALHPTSINACSHSGRTALHIAAARGNIAVVILLCGQSAHINPLMLYKEELLTPLDLATRQNHQVVVDYLSMRQQALTAEQLPEEKRVSARTILQDQMADAKLKYGRRMRGEEEDEISGEKKIRRRQTDNSIKSKDGETSQEHRANSAEPRKRIPRQTSTSDLEADMEDKAKKLVEDRIEAIVREELRAVRAGEKIMERQNSRKKEKKMKGDGNTSDEELNKDASLDRKPAKSSVELEKKDRQRKEGSTDGQISEEESHGEYQGSSGILSGTDEELTDTDEHTRKGEGKENKMVAVRSKVKNSSANGKKLVVAKTRKNGPSTSEHHKNRVMKLRIAPIMDEDNADIFEDEWEELGTETRPTGKDAQRRYLHEKAIFQELTHLKRMQIQYGKVQEKILVHSLVGNFCKMHGLIPSEYKFSTFYAWEKFLYEQLKAIYVEERERLTTSNGVAPRVSQAQRLNKFETRLRQARAIPLNDRIRELTRIYGNGSMTAGKKAQKRELFGGQKRCDCLGKHLLVKTT